MPETARERAAAGVRIASDYHTLSLADVADAATVMIGAFDYVRS